MKAIWLWKTLFVFLFFWNSQTLSAQNPTIKFSKTQLSIDDVFDEIERQTHFTFAYTAATIDVTKTVQVQNSYASLSDTLQAVLKGTGASFKLRDQQILILTEKAPNVGQTVTGKITDAKGEGLPAVNVILKGTNIGTFADLDGNYSINLPANTQNPSLRFVFMGYVEKEANVNNKNAINIVLEEELSKLDEVVVVGYGTQKKSHLIGSVSQIKSSEITSRSVAQLSQVISGQNPGITVIQRSGQPGQDNSNIQIRGVGSFGSATSPLVLIDGIAGSMNNIDPNDVESMSFLKDASSSAIYGARAANGVILVTTKTGKSEKLIVTYNGYMSMQTPTTLPEMASSWEYAEMMNEALPNTYTQEQINKFKSGSDLDFYPNENYVEQYFKNSLQTGHNVTLANGNKSSQYMASFGYMFQDGLVKKNDYDRYNVRVNLTSKLAQNLTLNTKAYGIISNNNEPAAVATMDYDDMLAMIGTVIRTPPIYASKMSNGDWGTGLVNKGTPISELNSQSFKKSRSTNLGLNLRLDWNLIPSLKLSLLGGYTQTNSADKRFKATQKLNNQIFLGPSTLDQGTAYSNYGTLQTLVEYNKRIHDHGFNLLAGHSFEKAYFDGLAAGRSDFPSNELPEMNLGDISGQTNKSNVGEWALDSYFGRLQYDYKGKYLAEFSMRYDGSSRFPSSSKYAFFPSFAAGWRIGQEAFIRDNYEWINEMKVKVSYGILGNQSALGPSGEQVYYPFQTVYSSGYNYPFGDQVASGLASNILKDSNLHWESTETKDIGLDLVLFKRKLSFSLAYFDKYSYDILVNPSGSVSNVLGMAVGVMNSGKLTNRGWEFSAGYTNTIGDFTYGVNGNLTIVKNRVKDLGVGNVTQPNGLVGNGSLFVDYPMDVYYGYKSNGLYVDNNDVSAWNGANNQSAINANPRPGDIRYMDLNGDNKSDATYDREVLGSRIPKYTFGMNLNLAYKGFEFSVLLQGIAGVKGYLNNQSGWAFYNFGSIQKWQIEERWTAENPNRDAKYPRLETVPNGGTPNTAISDYWILNGSYLRVKNMQLAYSFPKKLTTKLGLNDLRVHLSAENLLTFSAYRKGWDPEVNTGGNYYPILSSYTFGINFNF